MWVGIISDNPAHEMGDSPLSDESSMKYQAVARSRGLGVLG
jgi:hypothetical protein